MTKLTITYQRTCFPDQLSDHHNRDGEALVGVTVAGDSTVKDVRGELIRELEITDYGLPATVRNYQIRAAVMEDLGHLPGKNLWDSDLPIPPEEPRGDDPELPQAWFLLQWSGDEDYDAAGAEAHDRAAAALAHQRTADHVDGYDRDDLGESPDR